MDPARQVTPGAEPRRRDLRDLDQGAGEIISRAHQLARLPLEGIEQAAAELAAMASGSGDVVSRALRLARSELESDASVENKQVVSLIRRSIEVGLDHWDFEDTAPI